MKSKRVDSEDQMKIFKLNSMASFTLENTDMPDFDITERKLRDFLSFEKGWHYGEGELFDASRIELAIALNRRAFERGYYQTAAFPGIDGQVMLVVYYEDHDLELTLEVDDTITIVHEIGDHEESYREGASLEDAIEALKIFGRKSEWDSSESSTLDFTLTNIESNSEALRFRDLLQMEVSQPSIEFALVV